MPVPEIASKIHQFGLTEVYTAQSPLVDIVFVHGLNGHPYNTWATTKPEVFWPSQLLPDALEEERVRILTYGYDANVSVFTDGASKDKIHNHAEQLAAQLVANRSLRRAMERPIIFICHSLGGLVVKRCLIYCASIQSPKLERLRSIYISTYGILFLGTPHNGSDLAKWGSLLQSICQAALPKKFFDTSPHLIQALKTNNETLQNINRLFIEIIGRFRIYFFHESKPMDLKTTRSFVVDEDSAAPVIEGTSRMGIPKDHSQMCKFESVDDSAYPVVAEAIQFYSQESVNSIASRWVKEKQDRERNRQQAAREALGGNSIVSVIEFEPEYPAEIPHDAILVAPVGFRPNTTFFGFHHELEALHVALHDPEKNKRGSCSALVCGPPGSGKTHLTRQYLWDHQNDYPTGIFWIDSKSEESRLKSFWDIIQTVSLIEGAGLIDEGSFGHGEFVETVRRWLESKSGWLLVFDGVSIESEEVMERFRKFVPDRKGSHIIITSVDKNLSSRQRLFNPTAVPVQPLTEEEACQLLYDRVEITKPNSKQATKANEIVRYFQCLPLAIHAVGHRIMARGQALEKFHVESSSIDQRLAEPFIGIMKDLEDFQHIEAINLINILAFFDHEIPVEMIRLGRKGLADTNIEIRSEERPGSVHRDLDETIAILMRYGLCERSLQRYRVTIRASPTSLRRAQTDSSKAGAENEGTSKEDSSFESSSSTSSRHAIDVLRIHSVVQGFCRDELRNQNQEVYQSRLFVALKLFCSSYYAADERIKHGAGEGLRRDYREFETHAGRLRGHLPHRPDIIYQPLLQARHDFFDVLKIIRSEVKHGSPVKSIKNQGTFRHVSVFDRSGSESSDGPTTPSSSPSRRSTWNTTTGAIDESPIEMHVTPRVRVEGLGLGMIRTEHPPYDMGYDSDMDIAGRVFESSTVSPTTSDDAEHTLSRSPARRTPHLSNPDLILRRNLLEQRNATKAPKDLGNWHPSPSKSKTTTAITSPTLRPRTFSSNSASSEAEAALAEIHRISPPASRGEIQSPRGIENQSQTSRPRASSVTLNEVVHEYPREVLRGRPTNIPHSPLSNTHRFDRSPSQQKPSPTLPPSGTVTRSSSRAGRAHEPLPIVYNIAVTRANRTVTSPNIPIQIQRNAIAPPSHDGEMDVIPSGYTSTPMSRDVSRESHLSMISEPPRNRPTFSSSPVLAGPSISTSPQQPRTASTARLSHYQGDPMDLN